MDFPRFQGPVRAMYQSVEKCFRMHLRAASTVDPVTNDLASARQKKLWVPESRWSQEWVLAVKIACAAPGSM